MHVNARRIYLPWRFTMLHKFQTQKYWQMLNWGWSWESFLLWSSGMSLTNELRNSQSSNPDHSQCRTFVKTCFSNEPKELSYCISIHPTRAYMISLSFKSIFAMNDASKQHTSLKLRNNPIILNQLCKYFSRWKWINSLFFFFAEL